MVRSLLPFVVALVALVACGKDGNKHQSNPAPSAEQPEQSAPAPTLTPYEQEQLELKKQMRAAEERAERARHEAEVAQATVMQLVRDLEALDLSVGAAVDQVIAAQTDADRNAAKAKLQQLQNDKRELEQRLNEAKKNAIQ